MNANLFGHGNITGQDDAPTRRERKQSAVIPRNLPSRIQVKSELDFTRRAVKLARQLHWYTLHPRMYGGPGARVDADYGLSDLICISKRMPRLLFIELKISEHYNGRMRGMRDSQQQFAALAIALQAACPQIEYHCFLETQWRELNAVLMQDERFIDPSYIKRANDLYERFKTGSVLVDTD